MSGSRYLNFSRDTREAVKNVGAVKWRLPALATTRAGVHLKHDDGSSWDPSALHLFVDLDGVAVSSGLELRQHTPRPGDHLIVKPDRPWDGGSPGWGYIGPYISTVQVSATELRIYYFAEGTAGRFLCVAVSRTSGASWTKPALGLFEFNGSSANNIIAAGAPYGFLGSPDISAGTVFIDENPATPQSERFKMVMNWKGGAAMFTSADGYRFTNMTASPLLTGSDSQDVVFWHDPSRAYLYYGRSHLPGGQNMSCRESLLPEMRPGLDVDEPARSINHFVIGEDVTKWPRHSADENASAQQVLNTDRDDPPCMDLYTSVATPLGDAFFFFPMMYNHWDTGYSQGRSNDGLLEARMAVSRHHAGPASYVSREAFFPRGEGHHRTNNTGVYEGAFSAAATAVARGLFQVGERTLLVGRGSQYTHGGYVGLPRPPCSGQTGPCTVESGLQLLQLRKNGFVSLSTAADNAAAIGVMTTVPFRLPSCSSSVVLELNIDVAIGRGAMAELRRASDGTQLGVSEQIIDGGVSTQVGWFKPATENTSMWVPAGCAYEAHLRNASVPVGACAAPDVHKQCTSSRDCATAVGRNTTCQGQPLACIHGICQNGVPGGEWCGHWITGAKRGSHVGLDILQLGLQRDEEVVLVLKMWASHLYSVQFLCTNERGGAARQSTVKLLI